MEIMVDDEKTEIEKVEAFQELSFCDTFKDIFIETDEFMSFVGKDN